MTNPRDNFIGRVLGAKEDAEKAIQGYGRRIRGNVLQGQKDFKSGKTPYYGTINPFR